jgi:hypothetical protein
VTASRQRGLDIGYLEVEAVTDRVIRRRPGPAADPEAVGVHACLALHETVVRRVVGVDPPSEQIGVEVLDLLLVLLNGVSHRLHEADATAILRTTAG